MDLLKDFLGEEVTVLLNITHAVLTEGGDVAEVPVMVDGVMIDYDENFVLVGKELISIDHIVTLKCTDYVSDILDDPNRPKLGDMN